MGSSLVQKVMLEEDGGHADGGEGKGARAAIRAGYAEIGLAMSGGDQRQGQYGSAVDWLDMGGKHAGHAAAFSARPEVAWVGCAM